jgi:serine phosphatase RsbU (regulator of sigma subunit)
MSERAGAPAQRVAPSVRSLEAAMPVDVVGTLVRHAEELSGGPVALYVADVGGTRLVRAQGGDSLPPLIPDLQVLGPDIPLEVLPVVQRLVERAVPGASVYPLVSGVRAIALLVAEGGRDPVLDRLAREAAAPLVEAGAYTDELDTVRRADMVTAAAEIQLNLLPPRCARFGPLELAGTILPAYDVGGDWFDYTQNREGVWIAVADGVGHGPAAAALAAVALGGFRAGRRNREGLVGAALRIDGAVRAAGGGSAFVTAILAHVTPDGSFTWINCGHPPPIAISARGGARELSSPGHYPLGLFEGPHPFTTTLQVLRAGERVVLYTDGVVDRRRDDQSELGLRGVRQAITAEPAVTATSTVIAVQRAVRNASEAALRDDSTVVVVRLAHD